MCSRRTASATDDAFALAEALSACGVPTARGGTWYAASVLRVIRCGKARRAAAL
jgi:hypothetical protein